MAESHTDDYRRTADTIETDDGFETVAPDVEPRGDVPADVLDAVQAAVDDAKTKLDTPILHNADDYRSGETSAVACLTARYNETPVVRDDGTVEGWKAPYQAREVFNEALADHLPDGVEYEIGNNSRTDFYEVSR